MKAVRAHAWGEALRVEELPEPAFTPGHSLVRMHAATVGQIDWSATIILAGALDRAQEKS